MKTKVLNVLAIVLMLLQAAGPIPALAMAATDQPDYAPGSLVTISGDNSDEAGYLPDETVRVAVNGPSDYAATCDAIVGADGYWFCQFTLAAEAPAGSYTYVATGLLSGVSQSGGFTVTIAPTPTTEPTQEPTQEPTAEPTAEPTQTPTESPPAEPTTEPTQVPTEEPTVAPTEASTATPQVTPVAQPFIQSDKADYYMNETVILTSGNWQPGETVSLYVNDDYGSTWYLSTDVQADSDGNFIYQFNLPAWIIAVYRVIATGTVSGVATMTFTDSPRISTVSVGTQTGALTYGTVGNATYNVTATRGNNGTVNGTYSVISGLPTGVSASFVPATFTSNGGSAFPSSTLTLTTSTTSPAGTFTFTVRLADGADQATNTGTLVIGKVTPTITWANPADITYNTAVSATQLNATANVPGSFAYTPLSGTVLNAGNGQTLSVGFTPTDTANYNNASKSVSINVLKASSTTAVTCPASATYTGAALTPCTVSVTGAGGLNLSPAAAYSNNTNVGIATANYTYAGDANHTGSSDSKTFSITKADSTTIVSCPASQVYTGAAIEPCTATVGGAGSLNQPLTVTYTDNVVVGTATASASYAGDANHNGSSDSETFAITPAASTTTVTCPANVTFTGLPLEPCTAVVTGAGGLNQPLAVTYADNTNAGTATANAAFAGDANHSPSSNSENFTIDKAASSVTVTCPVSEVYTGVAIEPCTAEANGAGLSPVDVSASLTYTDNVVVGVATAEASYVGDANHNGSTGSETFEITRASSTVTVTCPANVTYTGSALTPCTAVVTGAGGLNQSLTVSYADNTNAGTAAASASFAGDANHNGSSDSESFTIDPAASTTLVTCLAGPFTYTGAAQTPCSVSVTGAGGLNLTPDPDYTDNVNAGTATASYTYPGGANHTGSSDSETFSIGQASSTTLVTCLPGPFTYDGTAQEPCSVSVTGAGGLNFTADPDYADNINAGTVTASYIYAGDANHTGSSDSESFTIGQASSTTVVTCVAGPFTYDGTAQQPCSVSVTGAGGLNLTPDPDYAANVNAGTATASYTYAGDVNHTGSSDSETFTIDKAASFTVVTCEAGPFTYTGSAQEPCSVSVTGAGGLNLTPDPDYAANVNAGTATASYTYAGDANHNSSGDSEAFTIDQASSTTVVTCDAGPFIYNGTAQTPCSVSVIGVGGLNLTPDPEYANNVNAGTATASYEYAGDDNHTGSSDSETFEIEKADSTTVVTCEAGPFTYTGSAQEPCAVSVTGVGGLNLTPDPEYANNVNAGMAAAGYEYAGDPNHNGSSDSKTFTIDKAASVTTVMCDPGPFIYNGAAHEPCAVTVTGTGGLSLTSDPDYSNNVNAGTASASYTYAGDANHEGSSDSETFTIDKAASVTMVTCPTNVTYTGAAHEPCTADVTGAGGLNQSLTVSYTGNVVVGTATASASYAGDANHFGSADSETFAITKAASTVTVTCPASRVYTGSAIEPCTAEATGVGMSLVDVTASLTYTENVVVGTATANTSWDGDDNHFGSTGSETFEITKAPSTVTVTCPASQVYTSSPIEPCTAQANGAGLSPINVSASLSYASNTNVGTATADASWAGDANHDGSTGSAAFEITKAASVTVVTCAAGPFVYNGSAFIPCSASVTGVGGLNQALTVSYADNTNAGTATASASFAGDANHNGSSDSESFTIDQASSTTTVTCPSNVTYTGAALTPCSADVSGAGGLNQALTVSYTDNVNAGAASASASYAGDSNHLASSDSETFTIDKAASTTTVTCPANVTYTGAALTPCSAAATGEGGLNQILMVSYTNNTSAGTATANASFAGDANHNGSSDSKTFTIDKAPSITSVACAAGPFVYDAAPHTPCSANVIGAGGLNLALIVSYTNNVNAGTATASASYAGDSNHLASSDSMDFTITKAPSTTTVTCPASVYFTGSPHTPCSAAVTGVGGLNQSLTVTYADNINVGTATASAAYAGDSNHAASSASKNFTIAAWTLKGFYQPVDMSVTTLVYNTIKGGSTVPLKFEIFSGAVELTDVAVVKSLTYAQTACNATATSDDIETLATGSTVLRYDSTGGQFIYNWKTPSTPGKCYRVTMTALDGSTLMAYFKTK